MATEKILIFDEAGNAKRMKVRIARFLDNEPVTASDKENIRTTLDVDGSQSGTFTTPLSVTSASDSSFTGGGSVGIGTASPSELLHLDATSGGVNSRALSRAHFGGQYANHSLVLGYCAKADTAGNAQMVVTETSGTGATGNPAAIRMKTGAIEFHTANSGTSGAAFSSQRWAISSSGNLVANSTGIDFGSGASTTISSYEEGTWSPAYATETANMTTPPTMDVVYARYVRVGGLVHLEAYIRTDSVDITGGSGNLIITGLPFAPNGSSYSSVDICFATHWGTNAPLAGYTYPGIGITLQKRTAANGETTSMSASDLTNGATANQNRLIFKATYYTTA